MGPLIMYPRGSFKKLIADIIMYLLLGFAVVSCGCGACCGPNVVMIVCHDKIIHRIIHVVLLSWRIVSEAPAETRKAKARTKTE